MLLAPRKPWLQHEAPGADQWLLLLDGAGLDHQVVDQRHAQLADTQRVTYARLGVEIRGCPQTLTRCPDAVLASEDDWSQEYLTRILSVRVVASMDQAINHIRTYGSNHTETIVTENLRRAHAFLRRVHSSCVMVNASTRFADGYQLGLGAEVGISTTKMHWYGPMGTEGLTTQKFIVFGDGTLIE